MPDTSTALENLCETFERAALPVPPITEVMRPRLASDGPGHWATPAVDRGRMLPPPFTDPATWSVRSHPPAALPDAWFIHPVCGGGGSAVVRHRHGPHHRATFDRFEALGMVDCLSAGIAPDRGPLAGCACSPAPDCRHVRTYRHDDKPNSHPGKIDVVSQPRLSPPRWCLASPWMMSRLGS